MKRMKNRTMMPFCVYAMVFLFFSASYAISLGGKSEESKVIFYVHWYDVGKSALDGLKGVKRVEKGFLNQKEINTVYYDPAMITIEEMETTLKKVGTYRGTEKSEASRLQGGACGALAGHEGGTH